MCADNSGSRSGHPAARHGSDGGGAEGDPGTFSPVAAYDMMYASQVTEGGVT
jgi:hypothetical protein